MNAFVGVSCPWLTPNQHKTYRINHIPQTSKRCFRRPAVAANLHLAKSVKECVSAAIEDYVVAGTNICVGDGDKHILIPFLDSIVPMVEIGRLVDIAFVGTTPKTRQLLKERQLPSDLSVNYNGRVDLFIAPVSRVDASCNAVLDSNDFGGDRYAAHIAEKVVLLTQEADFNKSRKGLESIPVRLVDFLPKRSVQSLCEESLYIAGVRGASLREGEENIADVTISRDCTPRIVEEELKRLTAVQAVGLIPSYKKTTIIVSCGDSPPFDITPPEHTFAGLADAKLEVISPKQVRKELNDLKVDWKMVEGLDANVQIRFEFNSVQGAEAFMRHVQHLGKSGAPVVELKQIRKQVHVVLGDKVGGSIGKAHLLAARELSRVHNGIL